MNYEQHKRYQKLFSENFYLLGVADGRGAAGKDGKRVLYRADISGSTQNVYTVYAHDDGSFFCSCPDGRSHAVKHGVVCKHVCFTTQRVLRLDFERDVYAHGYRVAADKWPATRARLERLCGGEVDRAVTHDALTARYKAAKAGAGEAALPVAAAGPAAGAAAGAGEAAPAASVTTETTDTHDEVLALLDKLGDDDLCAICYDLLVPAHPATAAHARELQTCGTCKQYVHCGCMAKWKSMHRTTCVYCNTRFVGLPVLPCAGAGAGAVAAPPAAKRRRAATAVEAEYLNLAE